MYTCLLTAYLPVYGCISGNDWDILNEFSVRAGMNLIFGLNALKRDGLKWDPTNALELLRYTQQKGYKLAGIELGNGMYVLVLICESISPLVMLGIERPEDRKLMESKIEGTARVLTVPKFPFQGFLQTQA